LRDIVVFNREERSGKVSQSGLKIILRQGIL
jgi:hypothetical protein